MEFNLEILTPITNTIYHKLKEPFLFYDISELGWSRYISAHLNYLSKNNKKIFVCCAKDRDVLYRDICDTFPLPNEYYEKFGNLLSASHHLYDPIKNIDIVDTNIISTPFKNNFPNFTVISEYSKFYNQRIFSPYKHSNESDLFCDKFRKCIIILPRYRTSRFGRRNISEENWVRLLSKLCVYFPNLDIISIGGKNGTLDIDLPFGNYYNLIPVENNLDLLVCLINTKKCILTVGTQSGIMHIATLCKSASFIIGHDPYDIIYPENFTKSDIYFHQVVETNRGYKIEDMDKIILKIVDVINIYEKNYTI